MYHSAKSSNLRPQDRGVSIWLELRSRVRFKLKAGKLAVWLLLLPIKVP